MCQRYCVHVVMIELPATAVKEHLWNIGNAAVSQTIRGVLTGLGDLLRVPAGGKRLRLAAAQLAPHLQSSVQKLQTADVH